MPTYNKIVINGEEIINLDDDTVTSTSQIANGVTFHLNNGEQATGIGEYAGECSINGSMISLDTGASYVTNAASIGYSAFGHCTSLTSIDVSNATSIGYSAFYDCTNLTSITIKNGVNIASASLLASCKIATFNNHLYWQNGDSTNNIYISDAVAGTPTKTLIGTLTSSNPSFTYTDGPYTITFARTGTSNNFSISWTETP